MILFIFGDSITQGLWDSRGGWADRVKSYVQSEEIKSGIKNYHEAYNLGVDGDTTKQIIKRFENEIKSRMWPDEKYVFIFATGINDTLYRNNKDFESTPKEYALNLEKLTILTKKYSDNISFLNISPVDEKLTNPLQYSSTGKCYSNERIDMFNSVLGKHCKKAGLALIKVNERFKKNKNYKELLIDGVHPNDSGHEIIYKIVLHHVINVLKSS